MTKDVLITISGSQMIDGESGQVEMITTGDYYQKNGKHYVRYEEVMEGFDGVVKNTIKIQPDCMDIMKTGLTDVHMKFEKDQKRLARYITPMGEMLVGLNTKDISLEEPDRPCAVFPGYRSAACFRVQHHYRHPVPRPGPGEPAVLMGGRWRENTKSSAPSCDRTRSARPGGVPEAKGGYQEAAAIEKRPT